MVEFKNMTLAGLIVVLLVLSSGVTYIIKPTGSYRTCTSGWVLIQSGDKEGMYACDARPNVYYDCVGIRDSKNTPGYYCDEGVRVEYKTEEVAVPQVKIKENICPDFITYSDNGKKFCRRYLDGSQECTSEIPY